MPARPKPSKSTRPPSRGAADPATARPSLKRVADLAGVSVATASLALRNSARCAAKTRRLVAQAAARLGYVPDPQIAKLMSYLHRPAGRKDGGTIGYITAFAEREGWRGLHTWEKYFNGAQRRASALGYRLEEFWLREPGMSEPRLSAVLQTRGIQGLIIAPLPNGMHHLNLEWGRFAAVAIGFSLHEPQLHRVAHDHFHSMLVALDRIRRLGYRRVGLVMRQRHDERVGGHWTAAFLGDRHAQASALTSIFDAPDEPARLLAWFRRFAPEVIIGDMLRVPQDLERAGIKLPGDYAFVHLNLPTEGRELAGIDQHSDRIGEAAVKQLIAALHQNETGVPRLPDTTLVRGDWVEGLSLPERTATARPPISIAAVWATVQNVVQAGSGEEARGAGADVPSARSFHG